MTFSIEDWRISISNQHIWRIFRCESQNELQKCVLDLPPDSLHRIQNALLHNESVDNSEIKTLRKDGQELWILLSARTTTERSLAQAVVVDITERRQSEQKIREQSALLDQTQDAIFVIDCKGRISYWNSGAELTYGWKSVEAVGCAAIDLLYDSSREEDFHSSLEDVRQYNEWAGEQVHKRKDGKEILVESRWKTVDKKTEGQRMIMIVNSDITEKRRLEQQSVRAQKMESIAVLTGGLAHDLQNILAPVKMSIDMLKDDLPGDSSNKLLKAIEERTRSGLEMVRNILTYGKGIKGERIEVHVSEVLEQVLTMMFSEPSDGFQVVRNFHQQKWAVLGDPHQLKQAFMNLCVNARESMTEGGVLTVEARDLDTDEKLLEHYPNAETGPYVLIRISDTGMGIPKEHLDRIFEPFFTMKEGSGGTGLGLSVVHGIVASHKGYITVASELGRGTVFGVYLPAVVSSTN
jgi:two-component system cell cycle sensor histidine kinase/response regulator CckA